MLFVLYGLCQVTALLKTLEFQESASSKGHFALYNCLVLSHTKYNGVQRIYCNPFSAKPFDGSHRLDMVMIRLPGINMAPLLFLQILSGMPGFCFCSQHLQWLTLDPSPSNAHSYQRWKHTTILRMVTIITIISIILHICVILINALQAGWNMSVPWSYTS